VDILEERIINIAENTISAKPVDSDSKIAKKEEAAIDDTISTTEELKVKHVPQANYIRNASVQEPIFDLGYTSTTGTGIEYGLADNKSVMYNPNSDEEEEYKRASVSEVESEMLTNQQAEELVEDYGYAFMMGTSASEINFNDMRKLCLYYAFNPALSKVYEKEHIHTDNYNVSW